MPALQLLQRTLETNLSYTVSRLKGLETTIGRMARHLPVFDRVIGLRAGHQQELNPLLDWYRLARVNGRPAVAATLSRHDQVGYVPDAATDHHSHGGSSNWPSSGSGIVTPGTQASISSSVEPIIRVKPSQIGASRTAGPSPPLEVEPEPPHHADHEVQDARRRAPLTIPASTVSAGRRIFAESA